jgi:hypothetical protein
LTRNDDCFWFGSAGKSIHNKKGVKESYTKEKFNLICHLSVWHVYSIAQELTINFSLSKTNIMLRCVLDIFIFVFVECRTEIRYHDSFIQILCEAYFKHENWKTLFMKASRGRRLLMDFSSTPTILYESSLLKLTKNILFNFHNSLYSRFLKHVDCHPGALDIR